MWVDALIYIKLRKFRGRLYAATWNLLVVITQISFTCFVVWGMRMVGESLVYILNRSY